MTAPAISSSTRYIPEGVTEFYFVAAMADYTSPTRSELNAGTNLTPEVADAGDWAITSASVDTPDLGNLFTSQITGKITADGTTLNMYADDASSDARSLMPRGTTGFIVKFPEGDVAGHKMDVFPVKVGSVPKPTSMGNPSTLNFTYYVTKVPAENVTVPA